MIPAGCSGRHSRRHGEVTCEDILSSPLALAARPEEDPVVLSSAGSSVHPTAIVNELVALGEGCVVGPFVILGEGSQDRFGEEASLRIGDHALIRSHSVIYAGTALGRLVQTGHAVLDPRDDHHRRFREHRVAHRRRAPRLDRRRRPRPHERLHPGILGPRGRRMGRPERRAHQRALPARARAKQSLEGPRIRTGAKVGANVTLLPGVVIGRTRWWGPGRS